MAVDAAFDERELGEARSHRPNDQMPGEAQRTRTAQDPRHSGEDDAAHHDHHRAVPVIDGGVEDRVNGSEDGPLKTEVGDEPRPPCLIRIALTVLGNEARDDGIQPRE